MYIALLGRQPELSIAELERVYGSVRWFSPSSARVETTVPVDVQRLGGTQKVGRIVATIPSTQWRAISQTLIQDYVKKWHHAEQKITLGISVYDLPVSPRDVQKVGLVLKAKLKQAGVGLRLVPNQEAALSTATAHHNKLGLSPTKVELLIVVSDKETIIAESLGAQNISALAARDQGRPRRDAFVGMLPPKLAQMMINMAVGSLPGSLRILDPFCGTGVVLQESLLLEHRAYGTDLSEKMVHYSLENLSWLQTIRHTTLDYTVTEGDAMSTTWTGAIDAVVSEVYLGQPFSAPPSAAKLKEVSGNCAHITSQFLKNIRPQLSTGTPLVLAVPAWKNSDGDFTHLPVQDILRQSGYERLTLLTVDSSRLMYCRPDQIVARELLLLKAK